MNHFRAGVSSFRADIKRRIFLTWSWVQVVAQPLLFAGIALVLFQMSGHTERLTFAVLGGGLVGLWSVTLFNGGYGIQTERWAGTLELLFACPTPLYVIVVG